MKKELSILLLSCVLFCCSFKVAAQDSVEVSSQDTIAQPAQVVITQPEFKGGFEAMYEYILDNFEYPDDARKKSMSGKVEVEFTIEKSGDVTFVGILQGLEPSVDEEVLRVLRNMPNWIPATRNGDPVRYKVSMPISLKVSRSKNGAKSNYQP